MRQSFIPEHLRELIEQKKAELPRRKREGSGDVYRVGKGERELVPMEELAAPPEVKNETRPTVGHSTGKKGF